MAQSILIVDDERDIVSMLNQYFCKIGYGTYLPIIFISIVVQNRIADKFLIISPML